jgi:nucleoid-associated protein YgaU
MLEKAYLISEKDYLTKKTESSSRVDFVFNPNELSIEKSNLYAETQIPGLPSSTFQFVKGGVRTLTMNLFFDTYEQHKGTKALSDVRTLTDKITGWDSASSGGETASKGLMDIDSELHAPPVCYFIWGAFIFKCLIERVSKKFTMFLPNGVPVRATLNVTLKEYKDVETQLKETDFHSTDRTKVWHVKEGDTLSLIAAEEYGDQSLWKFIAEKNKIYNPRLLTPGIELIIPPLE